MSRLRRFRHLEGKRPERNQSAPAGGSLETATPTIACARCGDLLAEGASCGRCNAVIPVAPQGSEFMAAGSTPTSSRADRFRNLSGTGSIPLGREVAPRSAETDIANTVPAWRGEALPPEVAADIRRQLGIPEQQEVQREDLLGWAQRHLERPGTRNLLLLLGAGYFGRRLIGNLIGLVAGFMLLVFFLAYSACS